MAGRADALQPIAFVLAIGAVVVAVAVFLPKLLGAAGGVESEILSELQRVQAQGIQVAVPGTTEQLVTAELRWARITVSPSLEDPTRALVTATLDFEGQLGATKVSSLGLERMRFVLRDGDWVSEEGMAPVLVRILATLERRRQALEQGDLPTLQALVARPEDAVTPEVRELLALEKRRFTARHWYIRSERDEVLVTERFRLEGVLPDRPVDEVGDRRMTLKPRGREFVFDSALK